MFIEFIDVARLDLGVMKMIRLINQTDWPAIMEIQEEAYQEITPEALSVLQGKWRHSPDLCFVYEQEGTIRAYLLAHTWAGDLLPKLDAPLPDEMGCEYVFLHDLAVSNQAQGMGIGPSLVKQLYQSSTKIGLNSFRLVAVQGSVSYWQQFGFCPIPQIVSSGYGEDAVVMEKSQRGDECHFMKH